ncbi:MAG: AbrB family transcriptional regulator [Acetobacteraceae bacterium]|nr:AbrB family transcriptional regulator [Acetobacteraceae bacterium]
MAGGAVAAWLGVPLGWMIGAMLGVALLAWFTEVAAWEPVRAVSLLLLGLGLGQTFDGPVIAAVAAALPAMVAAGVLTILAGVLLSRPFARMARVERRTGYFCTVPGGITVMAVLAQREGVPIAPVTLAQSIRMVLVVLVFPPLLALAAPPVLDSVFQVPRPPFAAGGFALLLAAAGLLALGLRRFGLANPWMFGALTVTVALAATVGMPSGVPSPLIDAAQVGLGMVLGQRLTKRFLLSAPRLMTASVATMALLVLLLGLLAVPLALAFGLPVAAVVLGLAPGGMPEMAITAKALDLAVPLVLGFHLTRVVLCNLLVGPLWRLAVRLGWAA